MMGIAAIAKRNDQAGVSNALHRREKPLREDRSEGSSDFPLRLGAFKLLANDSADRQTRPLRHFLQPIQEFLCKTNCQSMTHTS
jgi:hypothetical protein